jgi:hypothetical protein
MMMMMMMMMTTAMRLCVSVLLQAGLFYRAVRMHLRLYNWDRLVTCDA